LPDNPIAARVDGTVRAVRIEENETLLDVQTIHGLDTKDPEVKAQADYDQALAQRSAETLNLSTRLATNQTDFLIADAELFDGDAGPAGAQGDYHADLARLHQAESTSEETQLNQLSIREIHKFTK
jgi:hypothetical protein